VLAILTVNLQDELKYFMPWIKHITVHKKNIQGKNIFNKNTAKKSSNKWKKYVETEYYIQTLKLQSNGNSPIKIKAVKTTPVDRSQTWDYVQLDKIRRKPYIIIALKQILLNNCTKIKISLYKRKGI